MKKTRNKNPKWVTESLIGVGLTASLSLGLDFLGMSLSQAIVSVLGPAAANWAATLAAWQTALLSAGMGLIFGGLILGAITAYVKKSTLRVDLDPTETVTVIGSIHSLFETIEAYEKGNWQLNSIKCGNAKKSVKRDRIVTDKGKINDTYLMYEIIRKLGSEISGDQIINDNITFTVNFITNKHKVRVKKAQLLDTLIKAQTQHWHAVAITPITKGSQEKQPCNKTRKDFMNWKNKISKTKVTQYLEGFKDDDKFTVTLVPPDGEQVIFDESKESNLLSIPKNHDQLSVISDDLIKAGVSPKCHLKIDDVDKGSLKSLKNSDESMDEKMPHKISIAKKNRRSHSP